MSNYNYHARKLKAAFEEHMNEYKAAYQEYEIALMQKQKAAERRNYANEYEWQTGMLKAEAKLRDAAKVLEATKKGAYEGLKEDMKQIRKGFIEELTEDRRAKAGDLDPEAMALIQSGVLNYDDVEGLIRDYDDNTTMLKVLSKYARNRATELTGKHADTPEKMLERQNWLMLSEGVKEGLGGKMHEWETLEDTVRTFSGMKRGNDSDAFIYSMLGRFDETAEAFDNF